MSLSLLLVSSLVMKTPSITNSSGFDSERLLAISRRMREFVASNQVSGAFVLVKRNGRTVFSDAAGMANLEEKRPVRPDTIFQIMSMTKPVTAIAVVMCAEAGRLCLDDPIEKYLPAFRGVKIKGEDGSLRAASVKPTIRHLLTHTAGFGSIDPGGLDDDAKRKLPLAEYVDLLAKEALVGEPGERIRYSGPGFATLGRIVEVASGVPFERFCQERIFGPLGMKDTFFFAPEDRYARIASTYIPGNGGLTPLEPNPYRKGARFANPAGGLYSTAEDMATLLECVAEGGAHRGYRLLSPAGVETMTTLQTGSLPMDGGDAQGFGLGFAVVRSAAGMMSLKPIGSFGHTGAFGTEFWTDRKRGIVAVFMAQGLDNVSPVRKTFNTMLNAAFVGP